MRSLEMQVYQLELLRKDMHQHYTTQQVKLSLSCVIFILKYLTGLVGFVEAAAEMVPPKTHEPLQRKISTDSLSRGSISNVAGGWNDPPPAMIKAKVSYL